MNDKPNPNAAPIVPRMPPTRDVVELQERVERLEQAVLLLAKHVGAVGWNYELQQALDKLRGIG